MKTCNLALWLVRDNTDVIFTLTSGKEQKIVLCFTLLTLKRHSIKYQERSFGGHAKSWHWGVALEFQHFLLWHMKCWGNYLKMHFALANLAKTSTKNKLARLLPLLHISPRIRSICTIIIVQILLYKYYYMQGNVLFSHVKNCVLKILLDVLFGFKSKDQYERNMLNKLKRSFKRKIYINSFCLMSQVLFFLGSSRWTHGKRTKK